MNWSLHLVYICSALCNYRSESEVIGHVMDRLNTSLYLTWTCRRHTVNTGCFESGWNLNSTVKVITLFWVVSVSCTGERWVILLPHSSRVIDSTWAQYQTYVNFPIFLPMLMGFHQVHQFFLLCLLCFLTHAGTWIAYSKSLVSEKKCLNVTSHLTKDEWRNGVHCPVQCLGVLIYMCIYCSYLYMSYLYCIVHGLSRCNEEGQQAIDFL